MNLLDEEEPNKWNSISKSITFLNASGDKRETLASEMIKKHYDSNEYYDFLFKAFAYGKDFKKMPHYYKWHKTIGDRALKNDHRGNLKWKRILERMTTNAFNKHKNFAESKDWRWSRLYTKNE